MADIEKPPFFGGLTAIDFFGWSNMAGPNGERSGKGIWSNDRVAKSIAFGWWCINDGDCLNDTIDS